jgi:hypothetical protein
MRTSLNELKQTEDFLEGNMEPEDQIVFRTKLLLHPALRINTACQRKVYAAVRQYGRTKLRLEIEEVHQSLFREPAHRSFRDRIYQLFSKT